MAVTTCVELFDGRQGSWNFKWERKYTRRFLVYTNDVRDDAIIVGAFVTSAAGGLGASYVVGAGHSYDTGALLQGVDPQQDAADPLRWSVTLTYDSHLDTGESGQSPTDVPKDPTARLPVVSGSFVRQPWVAISDQTGKAYVNGANQPYDPPVEFDRVFPEFKISVNISPDDFDMPTLTGYQEAINSDTWAGFAPKTVRLMGVEWGSEQYENGIAYIKTTWTLSVKSDGWFPWKILNTGYYERRYTGGGNFELRLIRDAFGHPLSAPSLLKTITSSNAGTMYTPGECIRSELPEWTLYKRFNEFPFTGVVPS